MLHTVLFLGANLRRASPAKAASKNVVVPQKVKAAIRDLKRQKEAEGEVRFRALLNKAKLEKEKRIKVAIRDALNTRLTYRGTNQDAALLDMYARNKRKAEQELKRIEKELRASKSIPLVVSIPELKITSRDDKQVKAPAKKPFSMSPDERFLQLFEATRQERIGKLQQQLAVKKATPKQMSVKVEKVSPMKKRRAPDASRKVIEKTMERGKNGTLSGEFVEERTPDPIHTEVEMKLAEDQAERRFAELLEAARIDKIKKLEKTKAIQKDIFLTDEASASDDAEEVDAAPVDLDDVAATLPTSIYREAEEEEVVAEMATQLDSANEEIALDDGESKRPVKVKQAKKSKLTHDIEELTADATLPIITDGSSTKPQSRRDKQKHRKPAAKMPSPPLPEVEEEPAHVAIAEEVALEPQVAPAHKSRPKKQAKRIVSAAALVAAQRSASDARQQYFELLEQERARKLSAINTVSVPQPVSWPALPIQRDYTSVVPVQATAGLFRL